jgi:hypothetical protein
MYLLFHCFNAVFYLYAHFLEDLNISEKWTIKIYHVCNYSPNVSSDQNVLIISLF